MMRGMPTMTLTNASLVARLLRRFGRFGVATLSLAAGAVAFAAIYLVTALTLEVWFPKLCLLAALGAAVGVYRLLDRLDLIPEDPDKLITLSLTEQRLEARTQPWISSDREP